MTSLVPARSLVEPWAARAAEDVALGLCMSSWVAHRRGQRRLGSALGAAGASVLEFAARLDQHRWPQ